MEIERAKPTYRKNTRSIIAPMSNLENLRKQAKQYLRWHRERYYPIAAIIRDQLPGFQQYSDPEILEADFKLADAQELVARREGFDSWQALRTGAHTAMSQSHPPIQPILTSVAPHLYVRDFNSSIDFFTTKLGFTIDFVYGEPPFYGEISRDNAKLALRFVEEPCFVEEIREREKLLSASITLGSADEIKQLYLQYQALNVPMHQTLRNEPWGAKTFIVSDPDGNLLLFASPGS